MSGIFIGHDSAGNLDLIRRLQPQVRHIIQIVDTQIPDAIRSMQATMAKAVAASKQDIRVNTVQQMELSTLFQKTNHLPENVALLAIAIDDKHSGIFHANGNAIHALSTDFNAPLYGMQQSFLGNGIVGGKMVDLAAHGKQAAEMAMTLLMHPEAKPQFATTIESYCAIDDRQFHRWNMNADALNNRCNRLFHAPSFWELHGRQIVIAVILAALVLLLLLAFELQRRKRIRADEEATRHKVALVHAARLSSVGELTASIVHEINQPLGAILANVSAASMMLSQHTFTETELKAILTDIREDNLRASETIKKLRALLSKHSLEVKPISLNEIVETSRSLLGNLAIRHHATLQIHLQDGLPSVLGDCTHLQQVMINLVSNGMESMDELPPEQRVLRIRTEVNEAGHVVLTVADFGAGIATDALDKIFDSFFTTKEEGMGMGLAIVKTIVEMHHGTITASNSPYGGAVFRVVIPAILS
ncbi:ATP-binding protein [Oxalicibacterium solurbis]|nr:ATP-binding protein [Oxalicibacterium solurbis]